MISDADNPILAVPNHHGHHGGFSGLSGWIIALSMRFGRTDVAELAASLAGVAPGDRVVDIGCGPGVAARLAAGRGASVTGVDPAEVMLGVARRADRRRAVTWTKAVAESLPLPDDSCDIAWSLSTVHHWPDLEGGLSEVRRVLADGGRFLATERRVDPGATGLASHGWTASQADSFAATCESAGFTEVERTTHTTRRGVLLAVLAR